MAVTMNPFEQRFEDKVRTTALTRGIRPSEFFLDHDKLRTGYVTKKQFSQVLWENFGLPLNEEDQDILLRKYDLKNDGRINYHTFCDLIDKPFNPNDLSRNPAQQKAKAPEFLGTERSLQRMDNEIEQRIESLLCKLSQYYQYRGINLRTCCEDFDLHHIGVIQESQFYRSFPRPPEVTEADVDMLVQKYRDPERGLLNYLNLHHDIVAIGERLQNELLKPSSAAANGHLGDYLPPIEQPGMDSTLQQIFDKLRVAVYKNGVRTSEFFKDYDKLRSGLITENQFVCGLSLALAKEAQLSRAEIQKVVEFYRTSDGRVRYKEFTDMLENAFNVPDLEKKPTQSVIRPPTGALGRTLPVLSEEEERRVAAVLDGQRDIARKRRLMVYQYFTDYDRGRGYTRVVTQSQFERTLHFLRLNVAPEDLKLLCKKFKASATGDIDYPAFAQVVDPDSVGFTRDEPAAEAVQMAAAAGPEGGDTAAAASSVSLEDLMARIRHHVLVNRRRVCEFFQDFDPLRKGSITRLQFWRGLSVLGLSPLGQHNLSHAQFAVIADHFANPNARDEVKWDEFVKEVESVFTQSDLEKQPTHQVPPCDLFLVPKPGTMVWGDMSDEHKHFVQEIMERLSQRANQRRVLMKPTFQDFDRHNNGHVTRAQFRQCLTYLELHASEQEMAALEALFCNDTGFNYLQFLEALQPSEKPTLMYVERLKDLRLANQKHGLPESQCVAKDLEGVLSKIKTKVFKERVRILEWLRDYDKLRSGRMVRSNFRRAMDLCSCELAESELAILEDHFQTPGEPDSVDYLRFSDEIESIFTIKELEKAPQLEVCQYKPPGQSGVNQLSAEMEQLHDRCMERLAEKVRKGRTQLFPLFEDYDRVHNGTVSRSQFRRVLSELHLASLVATEQDWLCLWRKYEVKVGGKDDVNYIGFCDKIYELAHFEWRKP